MPSPLAQQLIAQYGGVTDYRFSSVKQLKVATTLTTAFASVKVFEPWNDPGAKALLDLHPVAVWSSLSVRLAPRAGIYGRMCTFYGGWAPCGAPAPTTVAGMVALRGAVDVTYGGTGDPGTITSDIECLFDETLHDLLKAPYGDQGRPVFYYCFVESDIVDKRADADRFMLTFTGRFTVEGRY